MINPNSLVVSFVEGNIQNRFLIISEALKKFAETESAGLEEVNARLNLFWKEPYSNIDSKNMDQNLRGDLEASKKSLMNYNRTFGRIDLHLALMTSNYKLPDFLKENGLNLQALPQVQKEISLYWEDCYGTLLKKYSTIRDDLNLLRITLEKEIFLLERLINAQYISGFDLQREIIRLFNIERNLFWKIVKESKISDKDLKKVQDLYLISKSRAKEAIKAHLKVISTHAIKEIQESEDYLQKAMVVLTFVLGALNIWNNLKEKTIATGVKGFFNWINKRNQDKIEISIGHISTALHNITEPEQLKSVLSIL